DHAVSVAVLVRVANEIAQYPSQAFRIGYDQDARMRHVDLDVLPALLEQWFERANGARNHIPRVELASPQLHPPGLQPGNLEQVFDETRQLVRREVDIAQQAMQRWRHVGWLIGKNDG